jgi:hypothetical protein
MSVSMSVSANARLADNSVEDPLVDRTLYDEVITVTRKYFGPAADRFITRQIRSHLNKEPEHLCRRDLAALIDWIILATAMLFEDEKLVSSYAEDMKILVGDAKASRKR